MPDSVVTTFDVDADAAYEDKWGNKILGMDAYNQLKNDPGKEIISKGYTSIVVRGNQFFFLCVEWCEKE